MKIQNLLHEAKFTPLIYGYHITKLRHLDSIMKHGLVPNKEEGGYGYAGGIDYAEESLPGVYFAVSAIDAWVPSDALVVVAKVQPRSSEMDEDRLVDEFLPTTEISRHFDRVMEKYKDSSRITVEMDDEIDKMAIFWSAKTADYLVDYMDNRAIAIVRAATYRYIVELSEGLWFKSKGKVHDPSYFRELQNDLTKKLRYLNKTISKNGFRSFKINKTIGFRGSSRIVGVYVPSVNGGWRDLGEFHNKNPQPTTVDDPKKLKSMQRNY